VDWSTSYDAVGGGGLMSTVDDLLFWDRNFDHDKLGKGKLLQEMQTRGVLNNGKPISYGFGLGLLTYRGLPVVEHNGALGGYRAEMLRFPEQRFTVVCLCNVSSAGVPNLARAVANIYLEKNLQPEGDTIQSSSGSGFPDPSLFAGKYLDPRRHFVYSFTSVEGNLMAWGANLRRVGPEPIQGLGDWHHHF
jgi:hypothetical protein